MAGELSLFLDLFGLICVIVVFSVFVTRSHWFTEALERRFTWKNRTVLIIFFGLLSVYGTLGGVEVLGAPLNVRDIGPMAAGLFCGPYVGIGAGIIGGVQRFTMGGPTCLPCSLATVLSGVFAGILYILLKDRFAGVKIAVAFAVAMESFHMLITILLVSPPEVAYEIVSRAALPMILANAIGMFIFSYLVSNILTERKTEGERNLYRSEVARNKAELDIASEIQNDFLPKKMPDIPGFSLYAMNTPAKEVGGDFYDFVDCAGGSTGIVIADVSGKGVPAALFMMLSKTLMHASAGWHRSVKRALESANNMISGESESGMFVTLCYSVVDPGSGRIVYANAGHCPPFLLKASGDEFIRLNPTGMALGVIEENEYGTGEVNVSSGDLIVYFTDGITEAINGDDEEFGEERLKEVILNNRYESPERIAGSITESVSSHSSGELQFDDITLVILKVL